MKIIINADMIKEFFGTNQPTVAQILDNKIIKHMIKNCAVTSVYQDDMDASNLNNIVIKLIPSLKGSNNHGK